MKRAKIKMENDNAKYEMLPATSRKLLMISTDKLIFQEGSAVRARQIEYAKDWKEAHIIVFCGGDSSEAAISPNCFVYSTKSISKFLYPFDAIKLGRFIIERRGITDITCQDPFLTAMTGVSLKKRFNLPLEIQVHGDIGSPYYSKTVGNRIRKTMALSYLPKADHVRVVSERIKHYLKTLDFRFRGNDKVEVRPIFVDIEKIKIAPITVDLHKKYPRFDEIVLMASRLEKEKDIELAINAWPEVLEKLPQAGLIIVGSGSQLSTFNFQLSKLGLKDSVIIENWADQSTLASYYKTADLFLVTSLFEGYGMTLVEARAAGCEIISTDVGVAREIGATIIEHDSEDVAKKVTSALMNQKSKIKNPSFAKATEGKQESGPGIQN